MNDHASRLNVANLAIDLVRGRVCNPELELSRRNPHVIAAECFALAEATISLVNQYVGNHKDAAEFTRMCKMHRIPLHRLEFNSASVTGLPLTDIDVDLDNDDDH